MERPIRIADLSFEFALDIVHLCRQLSSKKEFALANQLLRSGTGIGANINEASAAQSRKDFISKMAIASKEARETRYWLRLLSAANTCEMNYAPHLEKIEIIIKVLTKIVKTTQANS